MFARNDDVEETGRNEKIVVVGPAIDWVIVIYFKVELISKVDRVI